MARIVDRRKIRHARIRRKVFGTPERPRLCIYKSLKYIYAQIIDDTRGHTIVSATSLEKGLSGINNRDTIESAKKVGELIAKRAIEKGIKKVVFDRSGYPYHGRVAAFAEAARTAGLEF